MPFSSCYTSDFVSLQKEKVGSIFCSPHLSLVSEGGQRAFAPRLNFSVNKLVSSLWNEVKPKEGRKKFPSGILKFSIAILLSYTVKLYSFCNSKLATKTLCKTIHSCCITYKFSKPANCMRMAKSVKVAQCLHSSLMRPEVEASFTATAKQAAV